MIMVLKVSLAVLAGVLIGAAAVSGIQSTDAKPGPAYLIAEVQVTDPATMQKYGQQVGATLAPFNHKYLVRGHNIQALEGEPPKGGVVIIQFDSMQKAREWYDSPAYQAIKPLRQSAATSRLYLVQGEPQ
jgi:uncharacterized protein (DUF1330 family)